MSHNVPRAGTLHQISYCRTCGAAYFDKGACMPSTERRVANALAVMVLDPVIRKFLEGHDPKALEQARQALKSAGEDLEFDFCLDTLGPKAL